MRHFLLVFFAIYSTFSYSEEWNYLFEVRSNESNSSYIFGGAHFGSIAVSAASLSKCVKEKLLESETVVMEGNIGEALSGRFSATQKTDRTRSVLEGLGVNELESLKTITARPTGVVDLQAMSPLDIYSSIFANRVFLGDQRLISNLSRGSDVLVLEAAIDAGKKIFAMESISDQRRFLEDVPVAGWIAMIHHAIQLTKDEKARNEHAEKSLTRQLVIMKGRDVTRLYEEEWNDPNYGEFNRITS